MPLPREDQSRPEERVLRQLVEALLYEGVITARQTAQGQHLRLDWATPARAWRCTAMIGPFGRPRIASGSIEMRILGEIWRPAELAPLVEALPASEARRDTLLAELTHTISLGRWNNATLARSDRRALPFARLDAALDEGHPYHPCYKARTGFGEADHAAFGPEAGATFRLIWLAVARPLLQQRLPGPEHEFWAAELGAVTLADLEQRRTDCGFDAASHGFLPLHPWQWRNLQQHPDLSAWVAAGDVALLGEAGDRYIASQSVRTLHNVDAPARASVKLGLGIVHTSSLRALVPHSVCVAPVISAWISAVITGDPLFKERYPLAILPEYAGMIADRNGPLAGHLAAVWRASIETMLAPGEAAIPFNALMMLEADGAPFIAPWVERYGLGPWLERLTEVAVLPVWHLLVAHGLAVEAHGQNMALIHRDGWPSRLVLRDFHESMEFTPGFLADPALAPDFASLDAEYRDGEPDEYFWASAPEALRELVMDTLFVFNLAEVSHLLAGAFGLDETRFWASLAGRLRRYAEEHGLEARQAALGHTESHLAVEALLTRKLVDSRAELHHRAPNPFACPPAQMLRTGT